MIGVIDFHHVVAVDIDFLHIRVIQIGGEDAKARHGPEYFQNRFIPKFGNITIIGLLLTLVIIFSFQGNVILENPLHILLIAIPLIIQTFLIFFIAYLACMIMNYLLWKNIS